MHGGTDSGCPQRKRLIQRANPNLCKAALQESLGCCDNTVPISPALTTHTTLRPGKHAQMRLFNSSCVLASAILSASYSASPALTNQINWWRSPKAILFCFIDLSNGGMRSMGGDPTFTIAMAMVPGLTWGSSLCALATNCV